MILSTNALLIAALIKIESSGNDLAIGDNGKARGPLQIHKAVVADVNRLSGSNHRWEEMTNRQLATKVCAMYLNHYATEARLGRPVTNADRARIWQGGPDGWKNKATLPYSKKVLKALEMK